MAKPEVSDLDRELEILEVELKRLEAEYNMYFSGRLPRPPWETRGRVHAMVRRLDNMHIANTGGRFRFNTLQSRYQAFADLIKTQVSTFKKKGSGDVAFRVAVKQGKVAFTARAMKGLDPDSEG